MSRSRQLALALVGCLVLALSALGMDQAVSGSDARLASQAPDALSTPPRPSSPKPNVVVILADDLDYSLMPYLPHVNELIRDQGASFPNFYVEQSSCCPSRASILSGLYAHNHGVIGNVWPEGGYDRWRETKEDDDLPVWLARAGWRSAMLGKYFNEYPYHPGAGLSDVQKDQRRRFVPPGWQSFASPVQGNAYAQNHYRLNVDGVVDEDFHEQYLDSWLGERLLALVDGEDDFDFKSGQKFVYYASYSPHTPYAYPRRFQDTFTDARYPRTPDFDEADVSDKFGLTALRRPLTPSDIAVIDETFRKRIRSMQVLDRNVAQLVKQLDAQGTLDNTYLIFTSDNGYVMGNHRREIGKYNQFQGTVNVPFYVRGPGIAPGSTYDDVTGNIDIAPTIADIAGAQAPSDVDGISLLDRLHGGAPIERTFYLLGRALTPSNAVPVGGLEEPTELGEPTRASTLSDFTGVVNGRFKLIRYTNIAHEELYDLQRDPYELENLLRDGQASYDAMTPQERRTVDALRRELARLVACAGLTCQ